MEPAIQLVRNHWRSVVEIRIMGAVIYQCYLYFRGTRGAKVLTGLVLLFFGLSFLSYLLQLAVISWLLEKFTVFLAVALLVIFQPELRRALAELGSHHFFAAAGEKREDIEKLADAVFALAHRQFGSLIAIERDTGLQTLAESGVVMESEFSPELVLTVFHPKTALHDGGMILRESRILAAGCIFPVSQREDLDRSLGLRHRAALGVTEESDAIAVVVSEETGAVSICFRGKIERDFNLESFKRRLSQIMLLEKYEKSDPAQLETENPFAAVGDSDLVRPAKKSEHQSAARSDD